jgi:spoIIIJ-associated protein
MRSVETEGATIDEAIGRALELLRIERDKVDVEIVENATRGVLGFGGKPARIRARVRNPLDASGESAPAPVAQETTGAPDAEVAAARDVLAEILRQLDVNGPADAERADDGVWRFRLPAGAGGILIGRHGQTLDAIEYLLNRVVGRGGPGSPRIALDVEGYRERRHESVEQAAKRAADKARQTRRPVVLPPMSPRDRRDVHVALADEPGVTTRSEGEGGGRRVVVVPTGSSASRPR